MNYNVVVRHVINKHAEDITKLNNRIELLYEITKKQQEEIKQLKKIKNKNILIFFMDKIY